MTHLEVIVRGGVVPLPIKIFINNLDSAEDHSFERNESFSESYELSKGRYTILVGGMNAPEGDTTITLSGDFLKGPLPQSEYVLNQSPYAAIFYIEI